MLINEQNIVLEASIQMRFEAQLNNDRIVVAVDVGVDAVETLEDVSEKRGKGLGERNTNPAREHLLVVDVTLDPGHQVLDIFGCGHLGGLLVVLGVLPQVFESGVMSVVFAEEYRQSYSSVAFISGQLCGEQNSVIDPYKRLIWL